MRIAKRMSALVSVLLLAAMLSAAVCAQEVPDRTRTGSISAVMAYDGQAVGGGSLTLYRVGDISEDDGNYSFTLTEDLAASGVSLEDITDAALAQQLADYITANGVEAAVSAAIGTDGTVAIDGLSLGLYLVVQPEAADGYEAIAPFLVSIPMYENGAYVYDVNVEPKMGSLTQAAAGTTASTTETTASTEETTSSTTTEASSSTSSESTSSSTSSSTLPQTGQLNWPVPVLAALGLGLILAGGALRSDGRRRAHAA